jgi:Concanavalin A-like lectin/glucanases superfamily/VPDSG-CTERM motif
LDGASGYVQFASHIVPTSGSYTVVLSARETAPVFNYAEMISQGFTFGPGFYIGHDPSELIRASDSWIFTGVPFPSDGTFHTFALGVDSVAGDSKLYVDGLLAATLGSAISTTTFGSDTRFGQQFAPFAEYFGGELDNIRIYDEAIGPAGVPDSGSTVFLLGFASLGLVALRRKLRC